MSIKHRIWNYLKDHPHSSIQAISKALSIEEIIVLEHVDEMQKNRFIKMGNPVSLNGNDSWSSYYCIGDREYHDK